MLPISLRKSSHVTFADFAAGILAVGLAMISACHRDREPLVDNPMIDVPAGWYTHGCIGMTFRNDLPHLKAILKLAILDCLRRVPARRWSPAFAMNRYPVTRGAFSVCIDAGVCKREAGRLELAPSQNAPVLTSLAEAKAYCAWKDSRLPTYDEFQRAARGGSDQIFPWGDTPPTAAEQPCMADLDQLEECPSGRTPVQEVLGDSPIGISGLYGQSTEWYQAPEQASDHQYWHLSWRNPSTPPLPSLGEFTEFPTYQVWRPRLSQLPVLARPPEKYTDSEFVLPVGGMSAFGIGAPANVFVSTTVDTYHHGQAAAFRCVEERPSAPSPIEGATFPVIGPVFDERTWDLGDPTHPKPPATWKLPPEIPQP